MKKQISPNWVTTDLIKQIFNLKAKGFLGKLFLDIRILLSNVLEILAFDFSSFGIR